MTDCPTAENLELLSNRKLRVREFLSDLKHIETCEQCRSQIMLPSAEELLKRFESGGELNPKIQSEI